MRVRHAQEKFSDGINSMYAATMTPMARKLNVRFRPLDGRRFYALLDEVYGPKADAPINALDGRTPRDLLDELRRAFGDRKGDGSR